MVNPRILVWYWGQRGGGASYTLYLAQALRAALGEGSVDLALSRSNELLPEVEAAGFAPILSDSAWVGRLSVRERLARLAQAWRFAREAGRRDYSAIVIGMNFPLGWPLVRWARAQGARVTYVCHDAQPHPGDYMRLWQSLSQGRLLKGAHHVIALSGAVRDGLVAQGVPASKVTTLPIVAVTPRGVVAARPPRMAPSQPLRLLFLGRLLAYKGLDLLAEMAGALKERGDWRLTIAGSGPMEAQVQATFGADPHVALELGWLAPQRFAELIDAHDALLCPYTEASQSGVILEAMRRGVPTIVTPVGGLVEQVEEAGGGLVAAAVSGAAYAKAIEGILDDRSKLGALAESAARAIDNPARQEALRAAIARIVPS